MKEFFASSPHHSSYLVFEGGENDCSYSTVTGHCWSKILCQQKRRYWLTWQKAVSPETTTVRANSTRGSDCSSHLPFYIMQKKSYPGESIGQEKSDYSINLSSMFWHKMDRIYRMNKIFEPFYPVNLVNLVEKIKTPN
ncbi:MAG: hypothetical protein U0401_17505 [Anaerolineae bacterium]